MLDAIHPVDTDGLKTYDEIKTAVEAKFKLTYSETLLRGQFFHCVMTAEQSSRDFMQECWKSIRRTSCSTADQLQWVLTCFTIRHNNPEVLKAFEQNALATKEEALRIVDDVESKLREKTATAKVNAVLQETTNSPHAEVSFVNY